MLLKTRVNGIKNHLLTKDVIKKQIYDCLSLELALMNDIDTLTTIAECWVRAFKNGGTVFFMGNGGSAADAQHLAAELAGKYYLEREPLPAIALTTNTSLLTAIGNDYGYDNIFARQVKALARPDDIAVGISTSGNSPNILKAMEAARDAGVLTVAFTGPGGKLKDAADIVLSVASHDTPRIQEIHGIAGHLICYLVERSLFGNE